MVLISKVSEIKHPIIHFLCGYEGIIQNNFDAKLILKSPLSSLWSVMASRLCMS